MGFDESKDGADAYDDGRFEVTVYLDMVAAKDRWTAELRDRGPPMFALVMPWFLSAANAKEAAVRTIAKHVEAVKGGREHPCSMCNGAGKVEYKSGAMDADDWEEVDCHECKGTGLYWSDEDATRIEEAQP